MATTRTNLSAFDLPDARLRSRSLHRLGAGLLTGAAASLSLVLSPATATAAEPAPASSSSPAPSSAAQTAVDTARAQVGKPYEYGAAGPDSYDCSGLTQYAYRAAGIELPHSSKGQSELGTPVDRAHLQPGDLVFFYQPVSHVGIYVGDGQMIHAPNPTAPVRLAPIDQMPFAGATRVA
jgi:cell wall-associated NlpC family hydrolase